MRCQLNRLQKGQMIDEWFPLSSHVPLKGIEPGSLRVRARYSVEKIMPEEEYSEFKEVCVGLKCFSRAICKPTVACQSTTVGFYIPQIILQKEFHVIYALAHVCGQDRTLLASLLLKIFRHEMAEAPLLRTLNDREINMEGNRHAHEVQHRRFLRLRLCTDKPLFLWHINQTKPRRCSERPH